MENVGRMLNCSRCGQCCFLRDSNGVPYKKCKHLVVLKSGKTLCRVYNARLGRKIGPINKCTMRENVNINYKDCPWNVDGQREIEIDVKNRRVIKQ